MKRLILGAALSAAAVTAQAEFEDTKYNWYLDPMVFYSIADDDRGTAIEDGAGGRIIFGHRFGQHFSVELGFVGDQLSNNAGSDIARSGATIDARFDLSDGGLTPFLLIGGGALSVDQPNGTSENATVLNAGLGFLWQFHRNGTAIRSEVRAKQIEEDADSYLDYDIGVGIHIPLDPESTVAATTPFVAPIPADTDGDGVLDNADRCPNTPPSTRVDDNGCKVADNFTLRGLNFARNSAELTLGGPDLDRLLTTLRQYSDIRVLIAGHTDSRSTEAYNQKLSERRANGVKAWLVERGIAADRMETAGFGESRPITENNTAEGRAKNRRVEVQVLK